MDGTPTLRMNEFIASSVARGNTDHPEQSTVRPNIPAPEELSFVLNDEVQTFIKNAEKHYDELVGAHDMHVG